MNNGLFGFGTRIRFAESDNALIRADAYPEPLDRSPVDDEAAIDVDGLDGRDAHVRSL